MPHIISAYLRSSGDYQKHVGGSQRYTPLISIYVGASILSWLKAIYPP